MISVVRDEYHSSHSMSTRIVVLSSFYKLKERSYYTCKVVLYVEYNSFWLVYLTTSLSIHSSHNLVNTVGMFHSTLCVCHTAKQKVCMWVSRVGLRVVRVLPCMSDRVQRGCFVALSSEVYNQTSVITNHFTTSSNSRYWLHFTTHWILFKAKHTSPNVEYCTEKHVTTLRYSRCTEWMSTIRWPKLAGERWTASLSYVDHGPKLCTTQVFLRRVMSNSTARASLDSTVGLV